MNIGHLTATLGVDSRGLIKARRDMQLWERSAKRSLTRVNARLIQTGALMKQFGRSMTRYMTVPILAVGAASFKMYKDFEFSMTKITSLVGVARTQVKEWGQEIIDLAPQLGKAPKELAEALFFVTSAGIRGAKAMDVLKTSAKASAAGLGETKVVADLVTSAMNAYGSEVLNATLATDILVTTVKEGKAEADALAGSMGMVLPIASNLGVSFDQVGAAVASMTRTGTKATTASIQLRQILASILKPADQAKQALIGMGTSATQLRKKLREDGLISTLLELKELQKEYGEETLSIVFPNIRALSGVLDIVGANAADNIKIFDSLAQSTGATAVAFEEVSKTVEFQWQQAMSQARTTLTEIGKTTSEALLPVLKMLGEKLKQVSVWFGNLSDSQRRLALKVAALVAAIGPLSIALGWLVSVVLPGLLAVGFNLIKMLKLLRLAALANPWTALALAIGLVAVKLLFFTKRAEEATEAQIALNKAIEEGDKLIMNTRSIEERVGILNQLNKRQLEDLRLNIEGQIAAEEDYTATLKQELKKRIDTDKLILELKERILNAESGAVKAGLFRQIALRKQFIAEDLENLYSGNRDRLKALTDYLNQVISALKAFETKDPVIDIAVKTNISKITPFQQTLTAPEVADTKAYRKLGEELRKLSKIHKAYGDILAWNVGVENSLRKAIDSLLVEGISPYNEELQDLVKMYKLVQAESQKTRDEMKNMEEQYIDLGAMAQQFIVDITSTTAQGLANILTGQSDWQTFFANIYSALGNFLIQIGEAIVAYGAAAEAFKEAFENPYVAIIAGAALIVLGSLVNNLASEGLASGGTITQSGQFLVGERGPEMVNLPSGASVTANRDLMRMQASRGETQQVEFKLRGRDLVASVNLDRLLKDSY